MYKKNPLQKTSIKCNNAYLGESIEQKVRRILSNNEPIKDGAPLIFTERKDGVLPAYNIKTDRFEIAVEAMDGISRAHLAKREERIEAAKVVDMKPKKGGNAGGADKPSEGSAGGNSEK